MFFYFCVATSSYPQNPKKSFSLKPYRTKCETQMDHAVFTKSTPNLTNFSPLPQEYVPKEVFRREYLIGLHKKAKKVGFDIQRYNQLKDEAYELQTMLKLIRGPLHIHMCRVETKRAERLGQAVRSRESTSSSSSRSPSSSPSPSPSPERTVDHKHERRDHSSSKQAATWN